MFEVVNPACNGLFTHVGKLDNTVQALYIKIRGNIYRTAVPNEW